MTEGEPQTYQQHYTSKRKIAWTETATMYNSKYNSHVREFIQDMIRHHAEVTQRVLQNCYIILNPSDSNQHPQTKERRGVEKTTEKRKKQTHERNIPRLRSQNPWASFPTSSGPLGRSGRRGPWSRRSCGTQPLSCHGWWAQEFRRGRLQGIRRTCLPARNQARNYIWKKINSNS